MILRRRPAEALLIASFVAVVPMSGATGAEEQTQQTKARDAAEAVREGDVEQWLKYYQRERGLPEREAPAQTRECEDASKCTRPAAADAPKP